VIFENSNECERISTNNNNKGNLSEERRVMKVTYFPGTN